MEDILYRCSDSTMQHAMIQPAKGTNSRPLVVGLHTWSGDYRQDCGFPVYAAEYDWHLVMPDFRGPNWKPEGCGSARAVLDIIESVDEMCSRFSVDRDRIYLVGGSGGGHMSLLCAAKFPQCWAAVSAWCPISDLTAWYHQCRQRNLVYFPHMITACGGKPGESEEIDGEYRRRSSLSFLPPGQVNFDIATGIHDGFTGSVPVSQSIDAYNRLAAESDRISPAAAAIISATQTIPEELKVSAPDPAFGEKNPLLLRKCSNMVRLSLFEGGHDCLQFAAFEWLSRQKKGQTPDQANGQAEILSGKVNSKLGL